jgi:hypothetical protein
MRDPSAFQKIAFGNASSAQEQPGEYGGPQLTTESGRPGSDDDEAIAWKGEATYRVLSYYFTLRWNDMRIGEHAGRLLQRFAVAPDVREAFNAPVFGRARTYSLVHRSGERPAYALLYGEDDLVASDAPSVVLEHLFWHVNTHAFWNTGDFFLIHAGAVSTTTDVAVLLSGPAGSGKSTLVTALVRAGFGYLTDEAAAIDPVTRLVHPYPRPIALKRPPGDVFPGLRPLSDDPELVMSQWHVDPDDIRAGCVARPAPIGFVLLLRYEPGSRTELTPVSKGQAAHELGCNALSLVRYGARSLPLLSDIVNSAYTYRLRTGELHDAVTTLVDLTGTTGRF